MNPTRQKDYLQINTDRMTKATAEAVTRAYYQALDPVPPYFAKKWKRAPVSGLTHGHYFSTVATEQDEGLEGIIGFRGASTPADFKALSRQADLFAKMLLALTDIYYHQAKEAKGLVGFLHLPALMDHLGYVRPAGGKGHQPRNRRSVISALERLAHLEVNVIRPVFPDVCHLVGNAWVLRAVDSERQEIPWDSDYIPAIEFHPGIWRFDWEKSNYYPYGVDPRFMTLPTGDIGRGALLLGFWLIVDSGINRTKEGKRHLTSTLYTWAGLDGVYEKNPLRRWQKLVAILNDLVKTGVIRNWQQVGGKHVGIDFIHHIEGIDFRRL